MARPRRASLGFNVEKIGVLFRVVALLRCCLLAFLFGCSCISAPLKMAPSSCAPAGPPRGDASHSGENLIGGYIFPMRSLSLLVVLVVLVVLRGYSGKHSNT